MNEHTDKNDSGLEDLVGIEGQGIMHVINFLGFINKTLGGITQIRHQILLYLKCFVAVTEFVGMARVHLTKGEVHACDTFCKQL